MAERTPLPANEDSEILVGQILHELLLLRGEGEADGVYADLAITVDVADCSQNILGFDVPAMGGRAVRQQVNRIDPRVLERSFDRSEDIGHSARRSLLDEFLDLGASVVVGLVQVGGQGPPPYGQDVREAVQRLPFLTLLGKDFMLTR